MEVNPNKVLDAKGLACPMPIVKTKKEFNHLEPGQVMEVQATDKGSTADLKAWAESTGHQYLGTKEDGDVLKHYLRKSSEDDTSETKHEEVINLEQLKEKIDGDEKITVIDVREPAEYAFGHVPGSINIPLGELENRFDELNTEDDIHVICRTGNRSDLAAQKLANQGYKKVKNVVPGMSEWEGPTEQNH